MTSLQRTKWWNILQPNDSTKLSKMIWFIEYWYPELGHKLTRLIEKEWNNKHNE